MLQIVCFFPEICKKSYYVYVIVNMKEFRNNFHLNVYMCFMIKEVIYIPQTKRRKKINKNKNSQKTQKNKTSMPQHGFMPTAGLLNCMCFPTY